MTRPRRVRPTEAAATTPSEQIERAILSIRGQRVMLDSDLAKLYGVPTRRLNEQVRRNLERFPGDFMFELTEAETTALRSQIATSNTGRGGRRYAPLAFTPISLIKSPEGAQRPASRKKAKAKRDHL